MDYYNWTITIGLLQLDYYNCTIIQLLSCTCMHTYKYLCFYMYACIYNIWIFVHNGIPYTPFGVWLSSLVAMTSASMQQQDISGYEAAVGPFHHVAVHAC